MFRWLSLAFVGLLSLAPARILAQSPPKTLLRVGSVADFAPFVMRGEAGQVRGMDVEWVEELCRRSGYDCQFSQMDWAEVQKRLRRGELDVGFAGFKSEERSRYVYFLGDSLHRSTYQVFVLPNQEFAFTELKDLVGRTYAVGSGQKLGADFQALVDKEKLQVIAFDSIEAMFQALDAKNVNAVIGNSQQYRFYLKQKYKLNAYRVLSGEILSDQPSYVMISKKSPHAQSLLKSWNAIMKDLLRENFRQKLEDKYLGPRDKKRPVFE